MASHHYNPWPLGSLPENFQRSEPQLLRESGYAWEDPRDIVGLFENKLASYSGSKFAVAVDSCSNALFLALKLRKISGEVSTPAQTYVSVPLQIHHAGARPIFEDLEWSGLYELGQTGIWDSAARFTRDMFVGEDALQCLSFQIKKRLPIGRGGAILTNSESEYQALKLMTYDGRDLETPYSSDAHIKTIGWHMYMTPEDAARGILLMDQLPESNDDTMTWKNYPDLRDWEVIAELQNQSNGLD